MFTEMVQYMYQNLEHFGEILMVDGKAIQSFGTKLSKNKKSGARGEHDADWCKKQYSAGGPNGESIIKVKKWFGFRLHLIADATYEIPVAFSVTKASSSEKTETEKLLEKIEQEKDEWLKSCRYFLGDKGYDSSTDSLRYGFKPQKHDKWIFRIKCEEDRRIFTPVARNSIKREPDSQRDSLPIFRENVLPMETMHAEVFL